MSKKHNVDLKRSQLFTGDEKELDKIFGLKEDFFSTNQDPSLRWETTAKVFLRELSERFEVLYCFLSLNYWQLDSRIVRYNGLSKFLVKNYGGSLLRTEVEGSESIDGRVNFWGVVKLTNENYIQLFSLVDQLQTGVIFNNSNNDIGISKLADRLFKDMNFCKKSYTSSLNKIHAIRDLARDERSCIFTYSNEELGDYHMSIVSR